MNSSYCPQKEYRDRVSLGVSNFEEDRLESYDIGTKFYASNMAWSLVEANNLNIFRVGENVPVTEVMRPNKATNEEGGTRVEDQEVISQVPIQPRRSDRIRRKPKLPYDDFLWGRRCGDHRSMCTHNY
ncbi:hypothetical protein ACOME3_002540 [Neoechinorhynchus agilis]